MKSLFEKSTEICLVNGLSQLDGGFNTFWSIYIYMLYNSISEPDYGEPPIYSPECPKQFYGDR